MDTGIKRLVVLAIIVFVACIALRLHHFRWQGVNYEAAHIWVTTP